MSDKHDKGVIDSISNFGHKVYSSTKESLASAAETISEKLHFKSQELDKKIDQPKTELSDLDDTHRGVDITFSDQQKANQIKENIKDDTWRLKEDLKAGGSLTADKTKESLDDAASRIQSTYDMSKKQAEAVVQDAKSKAFEIGQHTETRFEHLKHVAEKHTPDVDDELHQELNVMMNES